MHILITFVFFALFFAMIGVGVWLKDRPVRGSCGGPQVLQDGSVGCCQEARGQQACQLEQGPESGNGSDDEIR